MTMMMMMIYHLQTLLLLGAQLVLSGWAPTAPTGPDNFFYHKFLNENGNKESMHMINKNVSGLRSYFLIQIGAMCVLLVHVINVMSTFPTVHFGGVKLHVESAQSSVFAVRGGNTTLPCRFWYEPELSSPREVRVKWSWLPAAGGHHETDVLVAIGSHSRGFGEFRLLKGQIMNL